MITGVVDVGGGMRGIYGAGVFDYFIENSIHFDLCIGVSAGSANIASYLAGQQGRNYRFYEDYSFRKEYMSSDNFFKNGSYLNMDYVYGTLSNSDGEDPLNYSKIAANKAEMLTVATNAVTGNPRYFTKEDMKQNDYRILMASCSLPGANKPYIVDGIPYLDGALGDPVPVKKAFEEGCDRVVLILTKPLNIPRSIGKDAIIADLIKRNYPLAAKKMRSRAERYNESVEFAKNLEKEGKVIIIAPDDISGMKTLKRDKEVMKKLYYKGLKDAQKVSHWF